MIIPVLKIVIHNVLSEICSNVTYFDHKEYSKAYYDNTVLNSLFPVLCLTVSEYDAGCIVII